MYAHAAPQWQEQAFRQRERFGSLICLNNREAGDEAQTASLTSAVVLALRRLNFKSCHALLVVRNSTPVVPPHILSLTTALVMMQASQESCEQMLSDMIAGFDGLLENVDALRAKNAELQKQLGALRRKYLITPAATEDGKLRSRSGSRGPEADGDDNTLPLETRAVRKAREVSKIWHERREPKREQVAPPSIELPEGHPPINEQDFTTPGATPGPLGCPFAAMMAEKNKAANTSTRPQKPPTPSSAVKEDPIAAEFHGSHVNSPPPSASGSGAKCPIRFLDQHKPEEVAQYFENHKHEIPRSHEICIKRYQTNEESIRELDAKYGNLVSMIQGLGKKHKSMLPGEARMYGPDDGDEDSQVLSDKDVAKIKRWAGAVPSEPTSELAMSEQLEHESAPDPAGQEPRIPRFDRDLRDVRLGESPSRPWGIQVPVEVEERDDPQVSESAHIGQGVLEEEAPSPGLSTPRNQKLPNGASEKFKLSTSSSPARSMVFNGPVFFGYSADEMGRLLKAVPELRSAVGLPS